jgi:nicotinate-nucleotide adenylyltransferase
MRIGIFGGTFDPPHLGHLILAAEARSQLELDKILWVVTAKSPYKTRQIISPVDCRVELVEATIQMDPGFELSRVDIERPAPYYSVDTIRILKEKDPNNQYFFLMGGDSLHDLPGWHKAQEFVQICDGIGVMHRPNEKIDLESLERKLPGMGAKVHFVDAPLLEIASQQIRQRVLEGRPYRYFLYPAVYDLIEKYKLYRSKNQG